MSPEKTTVGGDEAPGNADLTEGPARVWGRWLVLACAVLPFLESRLFGHVHDDHVLRGLGSLAADATVGLGTLWGADFFGTPNELTGQTGFWRPLVLLGFRLEAALAGGSWQGYLWLGHVVTVLWHAAATLALWRLLRALGLGNAAALVGAGLFGLHPVHVESVAWTSGRVDSIPAALAWTATAWWLEAPPGRSGPWRRAGVVLLLALAPLGKETGVLLVGLAGVAAWLRGRSPWQAARLPLAALALVLLARGLSFGFVHPLPEEAYTGPESAAARWFTWLSILPDLARFSLWPGPGTPLHPVLAAEGWGSPGVLAGLAVLFLLGAVAVIALRRRSAPGAYLALLGLGTLVVLAPWVRFPSGFPEVAGPLYERYLYAAVASTCALLGFGAARAVGARWGAAVTVLVVLAAVLAPTTSRRARVWADDVNLATAGLAVAPGSADLWAHLGAAYLEYLQNGGRDAPVAGQQALDAFDRALALDAEHLRARVNRFIALTLLGRAEEARAAARVLAERYPDEPLALHNLGAWHQAEGRHAEAVAVFRRALATGRAHPDTERRLQASEAALAGARDGSSGPAGAGGAGTRPGAGGASRR